MFNVKALNKSSLNIVETSSYWDDSSLFAAYILNYPLASFDFHSSTFQLITIRFIFFVLNFTHQLSL